MRININLKCERNTIIPFNYQYQLSTAIYNFIYSNDKDFAEKLHRSKDFKFFTHSWLFMPKSKVCKDGIICKDGNAFFKVSSPNDELMTNLIKGLFKTGNLCINNINFEVTSIINEKGYNSNIKKMKTISPILLRTKKERNGVDDIGGLKIYDLLPQEDSEKFYQNLKNNLKRKYSIYYNKDYENCDLDFDINILESKSKRVKIKDSFQRCSNLKFEIGGDEDLINFAYDCGLGELNSMGFGMIDIYSYKR
ncbi:CRISPR-associated endoribonuclease Cas6 [Methanococcus voltae]|uniref:CRISPR-associated endoribonuclease n=1 Tax=Methanococcus voltae TaxID=2188 RepID=A0A8J7UT32_METVO|nr:CRISPR-associated endoribonuclease Cas6 [Methanococcus voltae]MBP2173206.1 CRISPR-associated endoribonuclease Cas6 [Methanococcus voltae]MBP2201218.1 CRISPR-associated endoribonuclease Cas6 [Methanococcus voltae]